MALPPSQLSSLLTTSLQALLEPPSPDDKLSACPAPVLSILPTHPESLIRLARSKLYSWPYAQVPDCWRRLFVDASIVHAIYLTQKKLGIGGKSRDEGDGQGEEARENGTNRKNGLRDGNGSRMDKEEGNDWVQEVVNLLDMAIIMAGAEGRRDMIEAIIEQLRLHISSEEPSFRPVVENEQPQPKRRKLSTGNSGYSDTLPLSPEEQRPASVQYQIPSATAPLIWKFEQHLQEQKGPLVIKGSLEHWPAMHERPWRSPSYLMERAFGGRRLVPVEIGRSYTDDGWGQKVMRFGEFMDVYLLQGMNARGSTKRSGTNGHDYRSSEEQDDEDEQGKVGYLAQHDLFSQIPSLRNDISVPDYCYTDPPPSSPIKAGKDPPPKLSEPLLNAWFGPAGTVSPLHTDPYYNILCQVVGKKYIRLYHPDQSEKLYPRGDEGGVDMSNTSQVDTEGEPSGLDEHFPLFKGAQYVDTVLDEGQCLYIPVGWWHYVRSLSVSFSVSFWWN